MYSLQGMALVPQPHIHSVGVVSGVTGVHGVGGPSAVFLPGASSFGLSTNTAHPLYDLCPLAAGQDISKLGQ